MGKMTPRNAPVFNVITCKTATSAVGRKFLKNMVSKRVFLNDFKHNRALKRSHTSVFISTFYTFKKRTYGPELCDV